MIAAAVVIASAGMGAAVVVAPTIGVPVSDGFDDVLHVYLTLDGIPPDYQADLDWFDWTETTVQAPAGGEIILPIAVDIPDGTSPGYESLGVKVESIKWSSDAQDYGAIMVT
ncbi:hypothetical protein DRN85_06160 [Methanosarcinales archaeon]|nr:MAG: hypothetical protein DRN85_06160 [Methanosarcinales archaeon]